jgi:tRNA (guanine-N7-)-methyltransferase
MPAPPPIDLKPWFLTLEDLGPPPLDWRSFFGNDHPVEVEVGSGRGLFLVNAATVQPGTNFLGIEYDFKEGRRGARRLMKRVLPNARVLGADARVAVPRYIADASIAALHVYFPDPWWKRRHRKRRIFTPEFVAEAARILLPGGFLHAWTDVEEYFREIVALVEGHPGFLGLEPPEERPAQHDMDYHTSFERKKRKLGLPIHRARWRRAAAPPGAPA